MTVTCVPTIAGADSQERNDQLVWPNTVEGRDPIDASRDGGGQRDRKQARACHQAKAAAG